MRSTPLAGFAVAVGLLASPAGAFVLHTTADGKPVHWSGGSVEVIADASLAPLAPDVNALAQRCFAKWTAVRSAAPPTVSVEAGVAGPLGYSPGGTNENTLRFAPEGFPGADGALMITISTFDDSGVLLDADIVINGGPSHPFAELGLLSSGEGTSGQATSYDLEDVLTHEAGHFFGMAHAPLYPSDTMFPTAARGETIKRTLKPDDEAGIVALYPPGGSASCAASPEGSSPAGLAAFGLLALGLGALAFRRARGFRGKAAAGAATLAAAGLLFPVPFGSTRTGPAALSAELAPVITASETRWEGGLAVTRLDLSFCEGTAATCADRASVEVLGGRRDGVTQMVGDVPVPLVGERAPARRVAGKVIFLADIPLAADVLRAPR
jgi:Matrixin